MAMDGDKLGIAVANVLISKSSIPPTPDMVANIRQFWKDVCTEYVSHIQDNAEVPPGITVNASGYTGSTTGTGKVK
jgi:hypothetical protein